MLECFIRHGFDDDAWGDKPGWETPPLAPPDSPPQRPPPAIELHEGGVRRDRTAQFMRLRATASPKKRSRYPRLPAESGRDSTSLELRGIYEDVSRAQSSLASKLAQHNGLRQFGVDFANRVPPLELRMLLPELEASIAELLEALQRLIARLRALDLPASGRLRELCGNVGAHAARTYEESKAAFDQQKQHLEKLAIASPLFSPTLSPVLGKQLAAAMRSPPRSPGSPPTGPTSPDHSRESFELELVEHGDDSSDGSLELCAPVTTWQPFSAVLASHGATKPCAAAAR
mmetsp:Transcript_114766/g.325078  ORF Transcript_114766/g.325078 Transcript_114766/m.325078 type:complete len:288 (-) Transcript_114766:83-946(-)